MTKQKSSARFRFTGTMLFLALALFLIPATQAGDYRLYMLAAGVPCVMFLCCTVLARAFSMDRLVLALSLLFCALGIASLALTDPAAALVHAVSCGIGVIILIVGAVFVRSLSGSLLTAIVSAFLGLLLLAGKLIAPTFTLPVTQPALALLLVAFAVFLSREGPVSAAVLGFLSAVLLLLRGEPADCLIWGITILLLLFAVDGRPLVILPALAAFVFLFWTFYTRSIPEGVLPETLPADFLKTVGALGADTLPEGWAVPETGSLLPRLFCHYGPVFTGLAFLVYLPLILRGTTVASWARTRVHAILAMGACLLLGLYAIASLLSFFGFLPFAVSEMPMMTTSLPSLGAHLFLAGLLCGVSGRNDSDLAEDAHLAMLAK
ncbi:MAG: hypothetical protein J6Y48_12060 [Clostridia bacterium]|nr:hypothetical protein [Clostridia bacterium]